MIAINNLSVAFGGFRLFDSITFNVGDKDRIGLTGKNGAGKSTMLKVICGIQPPTEGTVTIPKDYSVGYLPQHMTYGDDKTVFEEAETALKDLKALQARVDEMNAELATRDDYESEAYMKFLIELSEKTERLAMMGGDSYKAEIETTLKGLGFERTDFERPTKEFSGGWRMRIELAKILLAKPDIILLDEPTNHLDIESIQWLEDFLKDYSGAVVVISHDRAFLDNVTTRTIEIVLGKIYDYKANYTKYLELRQERYEQQMNAYRNQQKMIEDTEKFIERFRYKATKSVQVQSRIKQLEKIERIQIDDFDKSALNIKFPPAPHSGVITVKGKHISKAFGDHVVINDVDFEIERGEKVAFVGGNGEGKTTMARMIMRELDHQGEIVLGHGVKVGYFAQNQADMLNPEDTVFDTIDRVAVGDIRLKIRDMLGAFMFSGEDIDKKVAVLSGGERTRLAMVRLLLEPVNLLILDEPTNHLDIRSKEILKQAIKDFGGTVIVVSHDREFLDGLVTKTYEFRGGKMKLHLGGIYDFLRDRKMESLRELEAASRSKTSVQTNGQQPTKGSNNAQGNPSVNTTGNPTSNTANKTIDKQTNSESKGGSTTPSSGAAIKPAKPQMTYEQKKEYDRKVNKLTKGIKTAEEQIAKTEQEIADLEKQMESCTSNEQATELSQKHGKASAALEELMQQWSELQEELEQLQG